MDSVLHDNSMYFLAKGKQKHAENMKVPLKMEERIFLHNNFYI